MLNETRASIEQAKDQYIVRAMDDEKKAEDKPESLESDSKKGDDGKA